MKVSLWMSGGAETTIEVIDNVNGMLLQRVDY